MRLTRTMRASIVDGSFPVFVQRFLDAMYPREGPEAQPVPRWVVDALLDAGIELAPHGDGAAAAAAGAAGAAGGAAAAE